MMIVVVWQYTFVKTEKEHEAEFHTFKIFIWIIIWIFFFKLYESSYNYVEGCSSVMRYFNELILKGRVKRVSLLLAISIDFDHMFVCLFSCM